MPTSPACSALRTKPEVAGRRREAPRWRYRWQLRCRRRREAGQGQAPVDQRKAMIRRPGRSPTKSQPGNRTPAEKVKKLLLAAHEADEDATTPSLPTPRRAVGDVEGQDASTSGRRRCQRRRRQRAGLAKAARELDRQVTTLQGGLAECVALLSKRNGLPAPRAHIMKAEGAANDTWTRRHPAGQACSSNADIEAAPKAARYLPRMALMLA